MVFIDYQNFFISSPGNGRTGEESLQQLSKKSEAL